jgi:hypothetical protein
MLMLLAMITTFVLLTPATPHLDVALTVSIVTMMTCVPEIVAILTLAVKMTKSLAMIITHVLLTHVLVMKVACITILSVTMVMYVLSILVAKKTDVNTHLPVAMIITHVQSMLAILPLVA